MSSSAPWWATHDPDTGRERGSKHLGHRDWNWFNKFQGSAIAPSDIDNSAEIPWAGHPAVASDRHDRTLGIPPRNFSMWPNYRSAQLVDHDELTLPYKSESSSSQANPGHVQQVEEILDDLRAIPVQPGPPNVSPALLAELLEELAPLVYGRSPTHQLRAVSDIARQNDVPTPTLLNLARSTGKLIAQTSQTPPSTRSGEPNLNRLLATDLNTASELLLARMTLATARAYSDPDLPRLWILANALNHAIPATVLTTQAALSRGRDATIIPKHDDLVGWRGIRAAVEHLDATVQAAQEGRRWINQLDHTSLHGEERFLALGIIQLTNPRTAYELSLHGSTAIDTSALRQIVADLRPVHVSTLSDAALKAVCDRNGWLLGTADERTQRELVERAIPRAFTADIRAQVATGDTTALTAALTQHAPSDPDLDYAAWHQAPSSDAAQRHQLLDLGSREAVYQFAGLQIEPHPTRSAALAGRFPNRLSEQGLKVSRGALVADVPTVHLVDHLPEPAELDLGL